MPPDPPLSREVREALNAVEGLPMSERELAQVRRIEACPRERARWGCFGAGNGHHQRIIGVD